MANQKIDVDGRLDQLMAGEDKKKVEAELGTDVKNTFVVSMFKSMGLSDKTLLMIEQDLTNALNLNDCVKFDGCNEFGISGHTGLMIE